MRVERSIGLFFYKKYLRRFSNMFNTETRASSFSCPFREAIFAYLSSRSSVTNSEDIIVSRKLCPVADGVPRLTGDTRCRHELERHFLLRHTSSLNTTSARDTSLRRARADPVNLDPDTFPLRRVVFPASAISPSSPLPGKRLQRIETVS